MIGGRSATVIAPSDGGVAGAISDGAG
jgi:hypothetical protein